MSIWQKIKQSLSTEKKHYLDSLSSYNLSDVFFNSLLRRTNNRVPLSDPSEAYRLHELVYACINKIADVMNDAEIVVERLTSDGEYETVKGHPLSNLIDKPNAAEVGEDFRRKMVISENIAGIVYIYMNRSRAKIPAEMLVLNPYRVRPIPNHDRTEILYYEYLQLNGQTTRIKKEDLLIRRRADLFNPNGQAPLNVALNTINSDIGLTTYVDAIFENGGSPEGILKLLNRTVSKEEKEKLQSDWKRRYGRGGRDQGGIAVFDQNATYEKLGHSLNELDSESISSRFESRICTVFGVPPILVGAFVGLRWVNQRASAKEALNDFWTNKISPELKPLRKWMTWFLLPEFESIEDIQSGRVRVGFDISQASFLQEEVNDIHERNRKDFVADGITRNEYREAIGKPPVDNGDVFKSEIAQANFAMRQNLLTTGKTEDEEEAEKEKSLPVKKNSKSFTYDGLELSREPTELEKRINLKGKVEDLQKASEKLAKLVLNIRSQLIKDAADQTESIGLTGSLEDLSLDVPRKQAKEAENLIKEIFITGQSQVIDELNAQTEGKSRELKEREFDIFTLVNLLFAKIISEVRNRAINIATLLYQLQSYSRAELESRLRDESQKTFEALARDSANLAIQAGREDEMDNQDIELFEYSAILDVNTCSNCKRWDGEQSENIEDLPRCPNADCDGGSHCRCFIIAIAET